jgi:hypothetical protein
MTAEIQKLAGEVVRGFQGQPALLAIMVLNVMMLGAGAWFLTALAKAQAARFDLILKACITKGAA